MDKRTLYAKKDEYLAKRQEIDEDLEDIRFRFLTLQEIAERQQERLDRIKTLMEGIGTIPTLSKLLAFLEALKELFRKGEEK